VRKTLRAIMGRQQRVKPGGVSVPMFNEKLTGKAAALQYTKKPIKGASNSPSRKSTAASAQSPTHPHPNDTTTSPTSPSSPKSPLALALGATSAPAAHTLETTGESYPQKKEETALEQHAQLWHPLLAREQEMRLAASLAAQALARAKETLAEARRVQLGCSKAVYEVEEGAKAYAEFAAGDFSVAVSQQHETRRLRKVCVCIREREREMRRLLKVCSSIR